MQEGICPYFAVRRMMPYVDVIIYSFHYLLDPKVAEQVSREMDKNAIVVFDEAHNIDNVCIESLSVDLTRPILDTAARNVQALSEKIEECVYSQECTAHLTETLWNVRTESSEQTQRNCKTNIKDWFKAYKSKIARETKSCGCPIPFFQKTF